MEKIKGFQITGMTLSGFKSFTQETTITFGNPTVITGGNGRGKSSIADAIAFAITGVPFFGERKLDRLHSDDIPELSIQLRFLDERGASHELTRTRVKSRMTISYDGYEIRQSDLTDLFGERDVFLSILNPLYFIEELGDNGKQLLERYLPLVPQETVLAQLSDATQNALQGMELVAPEGLIKRLRESIREAESTITYLQGQQDMADSQQSAKSVKIEELTKQLKALQSECRALEEKQFSGMDVSAMQEELAECSARYSELIQDLQVRTMQTDDRLMELQRKLGARRAAVYEPKYAGPIAATAAKIRDLGLQYKKELSQCSAIVPGFQCPTCRRNVTETDIPAVQAAFKASVGRIVAEGREAKAQLLELQELERKSQETFEQFKADDIAKLELEISESTKPEKVSTDPEDTQQGSALSRRIQQLTSDLEFGQLSQEEYSRLQECKEAIAAVSADLRSQEALVLPSAEEISKRIASLQTQVSADKETIQHLLFYISKRADLTFSCLHGNRVAISLYDVVKSTGEFKDTFRFTYNGRRYDRLSLSEKIRAGMEVSELLKRLTGRCYPTFVDNMESVDDLNNVRPTGQIIMAKCVANTDLVVRPVAPIATPCAPRAA